MVSDRNRQIVERRRSGESFSAIGAALGISRVDRLPQQPNPLHLPPRLRNMLTKLFRTPNFTPNDVVALEYSVAMFWTIPNFGLQDWKELKTWMERAGKSPALQRVGGSQHFRDSQ